MLPFVVRLPNINKLYLEHNLVNLVHWTVILIIGLYISYKFYLNIPINDYLYNILFITGIITIFSHIYIMYKKIKKNNSIKNKII